MPGYDSGGKQRRHMTLNVTVATRECIYQCADYALVDPRTGRSVRVESRKVVLVNAFRWAATVCYTGIAQTPDGTFVGEWLSALVDDIALDGSFDQLLDRLVAADTWLSAYPLKTRRISFSVGAFDGVDPVVALVSNFEDLSGRQFSAVAANLGVHRLRPTKPRAYVTGQAQAVSRADRRRLERLANQHPEPAQMYEALVSLNRRVAQALPQWVSTSCFTTHLTHTGNGGGQPHEAEGKALENLVALPPGVESDVRDFIRSRFPQGATLGALTIAHSPADERQHRALLRERPRDPNVYNNFGAFLKERRNDSHGAELQYLKALELDPGHVNALGNLANLRWDQRRLSEAQELYTSALAGNDLNENVVWNYIRFRRAEYNDVTSTRLVLDTAIDRHHSSARLRILRAEALISSDPAGAIRDLEAARNLGGDQAVVEPLYGCALQLAGRPIDECVAAYRTALAVSAPNGSLHLNLAQLLFAAGRDTEAVTHLSAAWRYGLDTAAQLEAIFYAVAHTPRESGGLLNRVEVLLAAGATLTWDVSPNVAAVERRNPLRARHLADLARVMMRELPVETLSRLARGLGVSYVQER